MKRLYWLAAIVTLIHYSCQNKSSENLTKDSLVLVALDSNTSSEHSNDSLAVPEEAEIVSSEQEYEAQEDFDYTYEGLINNQIKVKLNMFMFRDGQKARAVYLKTNKIINMDLRTLAVGKFELTEKVNDIVTGIWKLEVSSEDILTGTWFSPDGKKKLPIALSLIEDNFDDFLSKEEIKSGFYELRELNNDPETKEEFPILNAEELKVKNMADKTLYFDLYIQGSPPGVHIGMISGIANKSGNLYVYKNEEGCEISMSFVGEMVTLSQEGSGMNCEFGAGIGAYGTLRKIK